VPKAPAVQKAPAVSEDPAPSKKPAASKVPAVETAAATPNVVGMTVGQATAALQRAGLRAAVVDTDGNPATSGTVVAASAPKNMRVTLTVQAA
jgi:beta-lactam-binding protein with PASTA domain